MYLQGVSRCLLVKNLPANAGSVHGNPLQYSCQENPHGQRSLVGYSPQGQKTVGQDSACMQYLQNWARLNYSLIARYIP